MDDVGRMCLATAAIILTTALLFLLTATESSILDCSENKIKQLSDEKKDKRAKRVLALKDRRQDVKLTGLVARGIFVFVICFFGINVFHSPLKSAFSSLIADSERTCSALSYACIAALIAIIIPAAINTPKRMSGYEVIGENLALGGSSLFSAVMVILKPLTALAEVITNLFLRLSGVKDTEQDEPVSEEEILMLVDAVNDSGDIDENQAEMITNIFEFDDLEAKDVMTHRIDITGIERSEPFSKAAELAINEGFSRIPVYEGTIDSICGVIFSKDLLKLCYEGDPEGLTAGDICREISFFPESIKCGELFEQMSASKTQIAALVDEYGGTAGIVTMEDIIEAIVGSIEDEFDEGGAKSYYLLCIALVEFVFYAAYNGIVTMEDIIEAIVGSIEDEFDEGDAKQIIRLGTDSFDVSGTAKPDEVMEALELSCEIPEDFDTIGGFVIDLLGFIPSKTQKPTIKWNGIKFTVLRADETKIEKLRIKKLSPVPG